MTKTKNNLFLLLALALFMTGCGGKEAVKAIFKQRTPYDAYAHNLEKANLHKTALGQAWLEAGNRALRDSLLITLPYQETGYFRAERPTASSYTFRARQGELLDIEVKTRTKQDIKLFLDLFEVGSTRPREVSHVAAADTNSLRLEYKVTENLIFLVRLQPELLQSGSYTISIVAKPSLAFPVHGKDGRAIQSFWGDGRDNGARRHEGVDIFAPKGTPVVAGAKGVVSRVSETPIGGKVVWVIDAASRQSLYYAHLDKQLVQPGQQVKPGDTLGLIGNTGNAKFTPPHLHFGIYTFGRGAVDPFPYINDQAKKPAPLKVPEDRIGEWGRIAKNNVLVRTLPDAKAATFAKLPRNAAVEVIAGTGAWYKVKLPNGTTGFLSNENLESLSKPVQKQTLKSDLELTDKPHAAALPVAVLKKDTTVSVLAYYQDFRLVRLADGSVGWLVKG